ncbi:MAG: universal stress protein [Thermodesulfobacteriota bacterium]
MTPKFTRILFPTDLSEHARYSFKYAASVAALYKAGIVILHVQEEEASDNTRNMLSVFLGSEKMRELEQKQEENARSARDILIGKRQEADIVKEALSMFYEDLKPQLSRQDMPSDEILVKKGDTVDEIISAVRKYNCDLIVMGHGKYNALSEAVIGSTTKSVLRKSRVPVLVIPMPKK